MGIWTGLACCSACCSAQGGPVVRHNSLRWRAGEPVHAADLPSRWMVFSADQRENGGSGRVGSTPSSGAVGASLGASLGAALTSSPPRTRPAPRAAQAFWASSSNRRFGSHIEESSGSAMAARERSVRVRATISLARDRAREARLVLDWRWQCACWTAARSSKRPFAGPTGVVVSDPLWITVAANP